MKLELPTRDTKTVAFSPDGKLLAALTSDSQLHVWKFDGRERRSELLVSVAAVPNAQRAKERGSPRQAVWIDWIDRTHLGVATQAGAILSLSVDPQDWTYRLNELQVSH